MFLYQHQLIYIVSLLLLLFLSIGLSVHPLFVSDVHFSLPYIQNIGKFSLLISFILLINIFVKKIKFTQKVLLLLLFLLIIIIFSTFDIIHNSIAVYPSILVVFIFIFVFILFYRLILNKNYYIKINQAKNKTSIKNLKLIITIITVFFIFSMFLELFIKFSPSLIELKILLREKGMIVFPFRQTGYLLDANRWACTLLLLLSIFSYIKKELGIEHTAFEIITWLYLILTLSKTAFFIVLVILLIKLRLKLNIKLKKLLLAILLIILFIVSINSLGYKYQDSGLERRITFTLESISNPSETRTLNEREETYSAAIKSIISNPFIGKGYLNFTADTSEQKGISVHNTPLALMTYFGFYFGLFIFIFIFILPIYFLFKKYKINRQLIILLTILLIYINMLSVAHDIILLITFYITFIIYFLTKRIKLKNA